MVEGRAINALGATQRVQGALGKRGARGLEAAEQRSEGILNLDLINVGFDFYTIPEYVRTQPKDERKKGKN